MSRLRELVERLCPDGVEWKPLGELGSFFGGLTGKTKKDFGSGAPFVTYMNVFSNAKVNPEVVDYVNVGAKERQNALRRGDALFTVSSETPDECGMSSVVTFEPDGPLYLNSFCTGWRPYDPGALLPDYMAYVLRSHELRKQISRTANGVIRFNVSKPLLSEVRVPVPPLEVQREVVRILDSFQELDDALTAEIEAREKQYAHYRDAILSFPGGERATNKSESTLDKLVKQPCSDGVEWKYFDDVGTITRGKRFVKKDFVPEGIPCIHYGEMYTHYGISAKVTRSFVRNELSDKLRYAVPGDVVIVGAGETVEDIGFGVAWLGDSRVAIHDACYTFHHSLDPKFVSYYLGTSFFHAQIRPYISSAKISALSPEGLRKALIPVPPLEIQHEVVRILDSFQELISSSKDERDARRRQFAHYRDKLLSFPEKEA